MGNETAAFVEKLKTDWGNFLSWLNLAKIIGIVAKQVGNRFDKSKIAAMVKNG